MTATLSEPVLERAARVVALFSVLIHAWQTNAFYDAARLRTRSAHGEHFLWPLSHAQDEITPDYDTTCGKSLVQISLTR